MEQKEFQMEERYLQSACELLNQKIDFLGSKIFHKQENVQEFGRYIWENKGDMDAQELRGVRASNEQEAKLLLDEREYFQKLKKIQSSPYFGAIEFQKEGQLSKTIYIGMTYLKKDELHNVIYDWRAPICSLFYDYEVGECKYEAPEGIILGKLRKKRQFKIENQKLVHLFDNSLNINDDILQEVLADNSSEKMKNIVNTIQQEQNQVIRNVKDKHLIVQGIAGSGKTSVALHRIAFLLYKIPNLTSEKILIFSPNQIFTEYISNVLPELGEENTVQTTFHDYLNKIIKEYKHVETFIHFLSRYYQGQGQNNNLIFYKQSDLIIKKLEEFVEDFTRNARFQKGFVEHHVYEYSKEELDFLFHERFSVVPFFERIGQMSIKMSENNYNGKKSHSKTYAKLILESLGIRKDYRHILKLFFKSSFFPFELSDSDLAYLNNTKEIPYEDALILVYLKGLLEGFPYDSLMEQIVIDEAQDYNFLQYKILSKIFKKASFTILGDVNQNINPFYCYDSLEKLQELWKGKYVVLNKTYRSSEEIIDYTNKILNLSHVSAIRKELSLPVLRHHCKNIVEDIVYLQKKYKNTAIVTKDEYTARQVYDSLKDKFSISYIDGNTKTFQKDLIILPAYLAKGLEFDSVIVYQNYDSCYSESEKHLFYVSCTRAQHELIVYEVS